MAVWRVEWHFWTKCFDEIITGDTLTGSASTKNHKKKSKSVFSESTFWREKWRYWRYLSSMFRRRIDFFSIDVIRTLLRGASSTSHAVSDFEVLFFDTLSFFKHKLPRMNLIYFFKIFNKLPMFDCNRTICILPRVQFQLLVPSEWGKAQKLQKFHENPARGRIEMIKSAGKRSKKVTSEICLRHFLETLLSCWIFFR